MLGTGWGRESRGMSSITASEPCDHLTHMACKNPIGSAVGEDGVWGEGGGGGREGEWEREESSQHLM